MAKFSQTVRAVLIATMIAGLPGCGDGDKAPPPKAAPAAASAPVNVGGSASGISGSGLVLQLNGADDLAVNASGKFKFSKALNKGSSYAVTVKAAPAKQSCTVSQDSGSIGSAEVSNVAVTCNKNFAIGGKVSGLSGKGLVLQLRGAKDAEIAKNGNFVFPDARMIDGADFNVAIKATPAGKTCLIDAINTAPDNDTINIVAVKCSKKGHGK